MAERIRSSEAAGEKGAHLVVNSIDRTELLRLIEGEEAQVIDVLPDREYKQAHIPGAINLPLRRLTADTVSSLQRDKPVVAYCHDAL